MTAYFDGLKFDFFGINKSTRAKNTLPQSFYGLQYIHSGHLYLRVDGGELFELKGPVAFLTRPRALFEYGSPAGTVRDHLFVCFSGERVSEFIRKGLFPLNDSHPFVKITAPEQFFAEMLALIMLLQNSSMHELAVAKLEYLLLLMYNQPDGGMPCSFRREDIEELSRRIIVAPEQTWDFTAEAGKLNISAKHLIRLFQQVNGMPPTRFVLRQRLLKAAEMLVRCNDETIKNIAYQCGFDNEFYFSRVFRKYMKISPSFYRNRNPFLADGLPRDQQ